MNRKSLVAGLSLALIALAGAPAALAEPPAAAGIYRGTWEVVKFDVSPPLAEIDPGEIPTGPDLGGLMIDPDVPEAVYGPQDYDPIVQTWTEAPLIPGPFVSFDAQSNISGVAPPDPVGDVGPAHYVAMSNLHFAIYSKTGTLLYGPAATNTLWAGFGGDCQTDNSGDPIVLHDQMANRWILSQFTASGPTYFNCVAVSTSSDPLGTYYRYAFSTGTNFPDYPKYGIFEDAIYITTREIITGSGDTLGVYAVNRAQLLAGNPTPTVIGFALPPASAPYNQGNGLLPADLDGPVPPPPGSPGYFVGSMDNGGPYGAPQDALTFWKFVPNFATPASSTFTLTHTLPIAAFDTIPAFCSGRACVPQPGTTNKIDHLGYRQRPLHRLAYRNRGSYESLVTNQSVEASTTMSGIRWWEVRLVGGVPSIHQEGTYAPGTGDSIHRWMGSIATDAVGNMALGYSASAAATTFPSSWYTGRLAGSPLGVMDQGEGSIVNGTGSQTGGGNRWGDYTSMNVDPADDCSFWYTNQYLPTTSSSGWRLRAGAFKFAGCVSGHLFRDGVETGSFTAWSAKTP